MNPDIVKDLMVPLENYATVDQEATLYEAVIAMEESQKKIDQSRFKHRAVLVLDKNRKVVGKLDLINILRGLEPKYAQVEDLKELPLNFTTAFIQSLLEKYDLWQQPLDDICRKASIIKVKEIMYTPSEGEFISGQAGLNEAVHQLIIGRQQSLLVTSGPEVIGILRLSDVYEKVSQVIKTCEL